ncbi:MAG: tetratricopeptide repeat protein [Thiobacillus sp.]|nr:tetratricopeptide repeat protein [Thiobacillus sp.]
MTAAGEQVEYVLTRAEALDFARQVHRAGNLDAAEQIYRMVLADGPDEPVALQFLGILQHQRGDHEAALELLRRAAALSPDDPGLFNNLGNVLLEAGRLDEAIAAYRRCLALVPDFAEAHNNLGILYRARGELEAAEVAYRHAMALRPEQPEAYHNLGALRLAQGRIDEALELGNRAIVLNPRHARYHKFLARAYTSLGELDRAAQVYRDWLAEEPDNPVARHHLAACSGDDVPERAADAYVETTFDAFADSFDAKLEMLHYRAPELVAEAVRRALGEPSGSLDILDAGCGTGLCGPHLAPYATRLVGVDLSERMLARAAPRQVYGELVKAELTAYLAAATGAFDLIVSADTLCYFGALAKVVGTAHDALRPGGTLIFTVEAVDGAGFGINLHGRYSHSPAYVAEVLATAGFVDVEIERVILRSEAGKPVAGLAIIAHKQGGRD